MPRSVCFMVMPFGKKPVTDAAVNAPTEVDFDALWEKVHRPAIEAAGYTAIRADQDVGPMIIADMLQRLTWANLVVADLSIPNANVYYEVGVRHAARRDGCMLLAAEWAQLKFDLSSIRGVRYPLVNGEISDEEAEKLVAFFKPHYANAMKATSPVWECVQDYEVTLPKDPPDAFHDLVDSLSEFQRAVRTVRAAPADQRAEKALELQKNLLAAQGELLPSAAFEMLKLIRDSADWNEVIEYIEGLPPELKKLPYVQEQEALAKSHSKDPFEAIAQLEELIERYGDTPERRGLIGGRYKRLYRAAEDAGDSSLDRNRYLHRAIESYEKGAQLDLNDYYCVCNLAPLYRDRMEPGDQEAAERAGSLTLAACRRAKALGIGDEWLDATLLGAAVDSRDLAATHEVLASVKREPTEWKVRTTLDDLKHRVSQITQPVLKEEFERVVRTLQSVALDET